MPFQCHFPVLILPETFRLSIGYHITVRLCISSIFFIQAKANHNQAPLCSFHKPSVLILVLNLALMKSMWQYLFQIMVTGNLFTKSICSTFSKKNYFLEGYLNSKATFYLFCQLKSIK